MFGAVVDYRTHKVGSDAAVVVLAFARGVLLVSLWERKLQGLRNRSKRAEEYSSIAVIAIAMPHV